MAAFFSAVSDSTKEEIITEVENRPIIWNKSLIEHRKLDVVERAWKEISLATNLPVANLKSIWKYLRDYFRRQFNDVKFGKKSGNSVVQSYESKWKFYRSLLFLVDSVCPRTASGNAVVLVVDVSPEQIVGDSQPVATWPPEENSTELADTDLGLLLTPSSATGMASAASSTATSRTSSPLPSSPPRCPPPRTSTPLQSSSATFPIATYSSSGITKKRKSDDESINRLEDLSSKILKEYGESKDRDSSKLPPLYEFLRDEVEKLPIQYQEDCRDEFCEVLMKYRRQSRDDRTKRQN